MNKKIKRYDLNNITVEDLIKNEFKYCETGVINSIKTPRYFYIKFLCDEIELIIEIGINENGTLSFDDYENVLLIDDDFGQPYNPFYRDTEFPFLDKVINKYNEAMDDLVKKGILVDKVLENENISRKRK